MESVLLICSTQMTPWFFQLVRVGLLHVYLFYAKRSCKIVNIYPEYVSNVWHKMAPPKIQIFIRLAVQRKISTGLFFFTRGLMSYSQALCLSCKIHTWKIWSRFKTQLFLFVGHPWSEFVRIPCYICCFSRLYWCRFRVCYRSKMSLHSPLLYSYLFFSFNLYFFFVVSILMTI